jgi:ABC-2 type transport system permease protein
VSGLRRIVHVGLGSLRLATKDSSNVFWMLLMPIGFMFFFGVVVAGGEGDRQARVALSVLDEDGGFLARAFLKSLEEENFALEEVTREGLDSLETEPLRLLTLPAGFTRKVLRGEQVSLNFRKRAGSNVSYDFAADVHLHRAVVRTVGALAEAAVEEETPPGEGREEAAPVDPEFERRVRNVLGTPDHVTVAVETAGRGRPVPSGFQQSIPGVLTMFVLMSVLIGGGTELTEERRSGVLRRMAATPLVRGEILGGKVLGLTFVGLFQTVVLLLTGVALSAAPFLNVSVSWGANPVALAALLVAFCLACSGLSFALGALLRTPEQAGTIGWLAGMVMSGLGGCWWPLEIVPPVMKGMALLFPTGWAMRGFHNLASFGYGFTSIVPSLLVLLGFFALFTALGSRFLKLSR